MSKHQNLNYRKKNHLLFLSVLAVFLCCLLFNYSSIYAVPPTTITWVEGLSDETSAIKTYARPNVENALFQKGLLDTICTEGSITKNNIQTIYGVFGIAGEYTYQYFMVIKMTDATPYYFDADVLKEALDPATYDMPSVVNLRKSLHIQDPSLTGSSFGSVTTDSNKPVEAKQHDNFGYNLPPTVAPDTLLDQEIIDWWNEKYPQDASKVDFLSALEVADLYDAGTPIATPETIFGVSQATLLNMILDVHTITGSYPGIFDNDFKSSTLRTAKLTPFEAYTIWFKSYVLGKASDELTKEYDIPSSTVIAIVNYVTAKFVPVNQIERRVRAEWTAYFDAVKAVPLLENYGNYYKDVMNKVHIPFGAGSNIMIPGERELDSFLGIKPFALLKSLKKYDPDWAKKAEEANVVIRAKSWAFTKRIWPLLFGGYYDKILVNTITRTEQTRIEITPYDFFEALGALAYKGADGKTLVERASGLAKGQINVIVTEERAPFSTDDITAYEVIVNRFQNQARFFLHLQKKGLPSVQPLYDGLVKLKDQSVFNNLYGVGTDSFSGRNAFATDKAFYQTRADLSQKGTADSEINQMELRLLKSVWAATQGEPGGGWVITDPNAAGFIETSPGLYKAKIFNIAKIAKNKTFDQMVAFYTDPTGLWASRGFVAGNFSISGGAPFEEDYVYNGKTIHIDWNSELIPAGYREIIKKGLIDNGMLLSWIGETQLPASSFMQVRYLDSGGYKHNYIVSFEGGVPFVFGFVYNDEIPWSMEGQYNNFLIPVYNYWKAKLPENKIPVPKPGVVKKVVDPYDGLLKEVFTRGYLPGPDRYEFKTDLLKKIGESEINNIKGLLFRREASSLWMLWKGSGGKVLSDIGGDSNVIYVRSDLGASIPKYFDFDVVLHNKTFRDLFISFRQELALGFEKEILLGFYDAMKIDGMTDAQVLVAFDTVADISPKEVSEAKAVVMEGKQINWLDTDKENEEVPYKATQRKAIQKSIIEGDYGLVNKIVHNLFPAVEDEIIIKEITGQYWFSNCIRDYYSLKFNTNKGEKYFTVAVSNDRILDSESVRNVFDNWKKELLLRDPELGLARFGEIVKLESTDHKGNILYRNVITEEYAEDSFFAWDEFLNLAKDDPKRLLLLEAQAYAYATLYDISNEAPVLSKKNLVFAYPKHILFTKVAEDLYRAIPLNFNEINGPYNPAQMVDYYFIAIDEYLGHPELLLRPFKRILGRQFLADASAGSAFAGKINAYLSTLPEPGSIDDILDDLGVAKNQIGYSTLRDNLLQNILGKSINIDGVLYNIPSQLTTPAEYEQFYNVIIAALGEEGQVGEMRAFPESDVAAAMRIALSEVGLSQIDLDILKVVGINSKDDLKALLNNYPTFTMTTPKGYTLTPKKVYALLRGADFNQLLTDSFVSKSFTILDSGVFDKEAPQPLTMMFLTEADFMSSESICYNAGLVRVVDGAYFNNVYTFICRDLDSFLHELTHAQTKARLDKFLLKNNPRLRSEIYGVGKMVGLLEGDAQNGLIKKAETLDKVFDVQLSNYKVWNDKGFFWIFSKTVNTYEADDSLALTNWIKANGYITNPANYLKETEEYSEIVKQYGSDTFIDDYLREYIQSFISVDKFLKKFKLRYVTRIGVNKLVAVSDIHGGHDELVSLLINGGVIKRGGTLGDPNLIVIPAHLSKPEDKFTYIGGNTMLVFLGDYVSKGVDSVGVLYLIQALQSKTDVIALMGGQEAQLLQADIRDINPEDFGLDKTANTLGQFGFSNSEFEAYKKLFQKEGIINRATLEQLLDAGPIGCLERLNPKAAGFLRWMQQRPLIAKITLANGKSYLFMHAGLTEPAWKTIDSWNEYDIWAKLNSEVLTNNDLFYSLVKAKPEEWINNFELLNKIVSKLKADYVVAGHSNIMAWQKPPDEIKLVGQEIGSTKRIWGVNAINSPGLAVRGYPVQPKAFVIDSSTGIQVVNGDVFTSPTIENPIKFTLQKDGKIIVTAPDNTEKTILRKVFKQWYANEKDFYTFPNGHLDLTKEIEASYIVKGYKINLSLPTILFADEIGSYPFYFIYQPTAVDMYYQATPLGKTTFSLANNNQDLLIDTLNLQTNQIPNTPITATEAARALILKAYKLNSKTLNKIAAKTWLGTETWDAVDSLVTDGYLTYLGESGGYKNYQIQASMLSAAFTISEKGVPGTISVTGTKDAPSLSHGTTPIVTDGILPENTKFEIGEDNIVKFETGSDTYLIPVSTLLDLAESSFGVREFIVKLEGTTTVISLRNDVVMADGVTYQVKGTSAFWVEQVKYLEDGIEKFRWETGYRPGDPLAIPNEFKSSYMSNLDMIVLSRGRTPFTRALSNAGVIPTDLEVTFVRIGAEGVRGKLFVPYNDFVEKVLPNLPEASVYGNGYNVNLLNGNKIWFSSDVKDPAVWGEGPMFKNLGGYSIDGVPYKNYIKMLSLPSQEFILFPNFPSYSLAIYDVPIEPVAVGLGEIETTKLFGGRVLKLRMNVIINVAEDGSEEIMLDYPVTKMTMEPTYFRMQLARALNYIRTPLGGAVVFGSFNTVVIVVNYLSNENYTTEMLYGDLFGNAAFMGTWYIGGKAVGYLAKQAATNFARLGVGGLSLVIAPISIFVQDFASTFYSEWHRAEDVDSRLFNIQFGASTVAYRAWLDVINSWGNFLIGHQFEGGTIKPDIENTVANALWDEYLKTGLETGELKNLTEEEFFETKNTFMLDNALPKARKYGDMYREEIIDSIVEALAVNLVYPYYDRYGFHLPLPNPAYGNLPVSPSEAAEVITKGVGQLYERFSTGDAETELSLDTILGKEVFASKYSLGVLFGLARREVGDIKRILEDAQPYYAPGPQYDTYYPIRGLGVYGIFYTLGIPRCDEILALLNNADFVANGIYMSLLPNTDFEYAASEYTPLRTYKIEPPQLTFTLPNEVVFNGVKYYWDIKANNVTSGESLPSERWGFVGQ